MARKYVPGSIQKYGRAVFEDELDKVGSNLPKIQNSISNKQDRLRSVGVTPTAPKKEPNFLMKTLDIIDRPRNAVFGAIDAITDGRANMMGEGFMEGLSGKEHFYGSDMLERAGVDNPWAKGIGGFVLDTALDPLTYATTGLGSLAKGAITKTGGKLSREGAEAAAKAIFKRSTVDKMDEVMKALGAGGDISKGAELAHKAGHIADDSVDSFMKYVNKGVYGDDLVRKSTDIASKKLNATTQDLMKQWGVNSKEELASKLPVGKLNQLSPEQKMNMIDNFINLKTYGRDGMTKLAKGGVVDANFMRNARLGADDFGYLTAGKQYMSDLAEKTAKEYAQTAGKGLSIFGKEIVGGAQMQQIGADMGTKLSEITAKIPIIGDYIKGLSDVVAERTSKMFNPAYIMGLDDWGQREAFRLIKTRAEGVRREMDSKTLSTIQGLVDQVSPDDLPEIDVLIPKIIEGSASPAEIARLEELGEGAVKMKDEMMNMLKDMGFKEQQLNLLKDPIDDYFPHVQSWDYTKDGNLKIRGGKTSKLRMANLNSVKREYGSTIAEANQAIQAKYGIENFIENSSIKAFVQRSLQHNKVISDKLFLDELREGFGEVVTRENIGLLRDRGMDIVIPGRQIQIFKMGRDAAQDFNKTTTYADEVLSLARDINKQSGTMKRFVKNADKQFRNKATKFNTGVLNSTGKVSKAIEESTLNILGSSEHSIGRVTSKLSSIGDRITNAVGKVDTTITKGATQTVDAVSQLGGGIEGKVASLQNHITSNMERATNLISRADIPDTQKKALLDRISNKLAKVDTTISSKVENSVKQLEKLSSRGIKNTDSALKSINSNLDILNREIQYDLNSIVNTLNTNIDKSLGVAGRAQDTLEAVAHRNLIDVDKTNKVFNKRTVAAASKLGGLDTSISKLSDDATSAYKRILENEYDVLSTLSPNQAEALFGTSKEIDIYALPKGIVDKLNNANRKQFQAGEAILSDFIRSFNKMWVPAVTGLRPTYHINNEIGGITNNMLALGIKSLDPNLQKAAHSIGYAGAKAGTKVMREGAIELAGSTYTYQQIEDMMLRTGALNSYFTSDIRNVVEEAMDETVGIMNKGIKKRLTNPIKTTAKSLVDTGKHVGNAVERKNRSLLFMGMLDRGMTPEQAGKMVSKYHFNYSDITEFEKNMKLVMPFYTFMRKNTPLMLEELANDPKLFMALGNRLPNEMGNAFDADTENLPEWAAQKMMIPFGKSADGRTKLLDIPAPMQAMNEVMSAKNPIDGAINTTVGMLNPLFKVPLELNQNRSFFTQRPLEEFEGETAVNLINKFNLNNTNPSLAQFLMSHPDAVKGMSHMISQFGAVRDIGNFATGVNGAKKDGAIINSRDISHTNNPLANYVENAFLDPNMVKYYSPEKGYESALYNQDRHLGNEIQKIEAMGVEVPTMTELKDEANGTTINEYRNAWKKKYQSVYGKPKSASAVIRDLQLENHINSQEKLNKLKQSLVGFGIK